ncbi:MAG: MarR family transcriptional regulator [Proteobacteria bacterium]|uniref:MarR family winged helix-turn-helix transcriptional regulator n=1 Tax=Rudaea sp. TaxID=2136325 RepID=UPI00322082EC|nr:MarR family transcriptional regulator [Pseudomonadota bacterium]
MQKHLSLEGLRDDSSLAFLIWRIRENLLRLIERDIEADGNEINYSKYRVVKILATCGPQMPGELARFLQHNAGAMSRLLDQLEAKGYVQRKPHEQDRRALTIELTAAGQDQWRTMKKYMERAQETALRDLNAGDRAKLFDLLKRVRDTLDATP